MHTDDEPPRPPHWNLSVDLEIELAEVNIRAVVDEAERRVQEFGWVLLGSALRLGSEADGDFTYTLGLHKRNLPDIITSGLCGCSNEVVAAIADRQLRTCAFEDGQITQVRGEPLRVTHWPHTGRLRLLTEYYRRFSDAPTLMMVTPL